MKSLKPSLLIAVVLFSLTGCGYTQKSLLPSSIKSVHVPAVKNAIDLTSETDDVNKFRVYRPGLEVDVRNSIINRFIFDGNLEVVGADKADAILEVKLADYIRDPLRYSRGDDVQEYRLSVVLNVSLYESRNHSKVLWSGTVVGDTTFFLSGSRAISEDEATAVAVSDAARRVVERTIEYWD